MKKIKITYILLKVLIGILSGQMPLGSQSIELIQKIIFEGMSETWRRIICKVYFFLYVDLSVCVNYLRYT